VKGAVRGKRRQKGGRGDREKMFREENSSNRREKKQKNGRSEAEKGKEMEKVKNEGRKERKERRKGEGVLTE
jgi:hypothetical protein